MSDHTAPEPTMEEILASIRRIISEDDAPQGVAAAPEEDEPEYSTDADDYGEPVYEPEPEAVKPPVPETPPAVAAREETLVSAQTASAAASAFGELSSAVSAPRSDSRSLEDLAREMLKPMLRQWLDDNLPRIVQAAVQSEVERISRSRVG